MKDAQKAQIAMSALEKIKNYITGVSETNLGLDDEHLIEIDEMTCMAMRQIDHMNEVRPDWATAPKWAKFWAADSYGTMRFYDNRPQKDIGDACWLMRGGKMQIDRALDIYIPHWEDTLTERP